MKKKVQKGQAGYLRHQKIRRGLIAALMFAIPLTIYFSGIAWNGTRNNILTVVAIVGILPAARFAVSWIITLLQKEADPEIIKITEEEAGSLVHGYELAVTAYEGSVSLDALVICGNEIAAYSSSEKADLPFFEKHIVKILSTNDIFGARVRIFRDKDKYRERIRTLAKDPEKYREGVPEYTNEQYPELSREEIILHLIMAIAV